MDRKRVNSKSGNIVSAGYSDGICQIEFKTPDGKPNAVYECGDISEKEWKDFSSTFDSLDASTGSHYHKNLRSKKWVKQSK
jgi:hypothetical protein